ncbi:MAG: T9SS type A sorting domain-containing protein [Flavobacteriales bacterium]|nr:T9SS type A sorting domain-containing protein [Flavobacteriales bacterium]
MRKIILGILSLLLFVTFSFAQKREYWGMKHNAGEYGEGIIFKTDTGANNYEVQFTFPRIEGGGIGADAALFKASNGKFYGVTTHGGDNNFGIIFEWDAQSNAYTKKYDFDGTPNGSRPEGALMQASNGKLYGTSSLGGAFNNGVLYEYDPITEVYTKKINFNSPLNGEKPLERLVEASNGKLYGITSKGGTSNYGVFFEYDVASNSIRKIIDFDGTNLGRVTVSSLFEATNGKMYGTTGLGGTANLGTIFEYDLVSDTLIKIFDFTSSLNGEYPVHLMQAKNGKIYGAAHRGGINSHGTIFEFDILTRNYSKKADFLLDSTGFGPVNILVEDSLGNLYGITEDGAGQLNGILFKYNIASASLSKVLEFGPSTNNHQPTSGLSSIEAGKLIGLTENSIYEYDLNSSTYTSKIVFGSKPLGSSPTGALLKANNGNFYGLCSWGGKSGRGVIFEFNPILGKQTILKDLTLPDGARPLGALIEASNGKLYGLCSDGGLYGSGVLFEFDLQSNQYSKKIVFNKNFTGEDPVGPLFEHINGKLYGLTSRGGIHDDGVLFEYDFVLNNLAVKHHFNDVITGRRPGGGLMMAHNGLMYGTTSGGGLNNHGSIFEYNPVLDTLVKKYDFNNGTTMGGWLPVATMVENDTNKLIGTTFWGGATNSGTLFEFNIATNNFDKKWDFLNSGIGAFPNGSLLKASNDKLYGLSSEGGLFLNGDLFEYKPQSGTLIGKVDFNNNFQNFSLSRNNLIETEVCYNSYDSIAVFECNSYTVPSGKRSHIDVGNYTVWDTLTNYCGSDSILKINLTVYGNGTRIERHVACNSFTWIDGNTYTASTNSVMYNLSIPDYNGCDSVARLILSILQQQMGIDSHRVCGSFTWIDGFTYSSTTDSAQFTFVNGASNGCDSIVTLNLSITSIDTSISIIGDTSLRSNASSASYQWLDCNRNYAKIANETNRLFIPSDTGDFAVEITQNACVDTSACIPFVTTSIQEHSIFQNVIIFPNPTNRNLYLQLSNVKDINIRVYSLEGKLVYSAKQLKGGTQSIPFEVESGAYILELESKGKKPIIE